MPDVSPPEKLIDYVDLMEKYSTDSSVRPAIREILKYRFKEISPAFDRIFQVNYRVKLNILKDHLFQQSCVTS